MNIKITGESIKLGQLIKKIGEVSTGGRAADFLEKHTVKVNGVVTKTRSTKIKPGDIIWVDEQLYKIIGE